MHCLTCCLPQLRPSGTKQAETIRLAVQQRMKDGSLLFDCVQATWNVLEQSAGEWDRSMIKWAEG